MTKRGILLGLLATLAIVGMAIFSAGSASASVLCKTATNPCESKYGPGTVIELKATNLTKITEPKSVAYNLCPNVLIKGEVQKAGSATETVFGVITSFVVPECNLAPVTVLKKGAFTIADKEGGNGTLVLEGFEIKEEWNNCTYVGPLSIGLWGGKMASAEPVSNLISTSLLCTKEVKWDAEFTVNSPEPLYIEKQ